MKSGALRIALLYLVVALGWITLSKWLLLLPADLFAVRLMHRLDGVKAIIFVLINSLILYRLIRAEQRKLIESSKKMNKADAEAKRLGSILSRVSNMIFITDASNYLTWVNTAFEEFTGYRLHEIAGYTPATFFVGEETDHAVVEYIQQQKMAMRSFSVEVHCHSRTRRRFWACGEYTPLFSDAKLFLGYIAVYNDITAFKAKEDEATRYNHQLRAISRLSSQELRRPLANLIGLAELLKVSAERSEKDRILEKVGRSAEELDIVLQQLNSAICAELGETGLSAERQ